VLSSDTVLVAVDQKGEVLGFIAFSQDWVNQLYIAPGAQRAGIGSRLLQRAKASSGFLQLWTFQANTRARRFYRQHGFVELELTDGERNEEKTPDVRLEWRPLAC
jgi:GNAT superfamily N-acetyltransferase